MNVWKSIGIVVGVLVVGLLFVLVYQIGNYPHDLVSPVPMGSRLSELDRNLRRAPDSEGEVKGEGSNSYHGDYDAWTAPPEERDRFTGTITFYHFGSTSADVNHLEYKDGRLVEKDWGFLPG